MAKPNTVVPSVLVAIPQKNHSFETIDLCNGLLERCQQGDDIYIIDNGSTDEEIAATFAYADKHEEVGVLLQPVPNIHVSWNLAIAQAVRHNYDYLVLLNNDIEDINDDFITGLIDPLQTVWPLVATCPNYDGRDLEPGFIQTVNDIAAGRLDGSGGFAGFAFALRMSWVKTFGYQFPEECSWWYGDNDLVLTINQTGGVMGISGTSTCSHIGSMTITSEFGSTLPDSAEDDRLAHARKWLPVLEPAAAELLRQQDNAQRMADFTATPSGVN